MRLIAAGERPTVRTLPDRLEVDPEAVDHALRGLETAGLLTRDGASVSGAMGLTYEPTQYRLDLGDRELYAWCALDAVGIPAALGVSARIMSKTALTGREVEIHVEDGRPTTAEPVELFVTLPGAQAEFHDEQCPQIEFYDPRRAPRRGYARALTLDEAAELGRVIWSGKIG